MKRRKSVQSPWSGTKKPLAEGALSAKGTSPDGSKLASPRKGKNKLKKKIRIADILFGIILLAGISLLLYPSVTNMWNQHTQTHAISNYNYVTKDLSKKEKTEIWNKALKYNESLKSGGGLHTFTGEERKFYNSILDITGTGIMGYIKIPKVNIELPIYHGTSEFVLKAGVGHVEGTSFPTEGKGVHSAISGHTGMPSSKMFTSITKLKVGDKFIIHSLDHTLTYEIDKITTVLPENMEGLRIDKDKNYCTLITCTPYGVNTHRLLVRGHKVKNTYPEPNISKLDIISLTMLIAGVILLLYSFRAFVLKINKCLPGGGRCLFRTPPK